MRRLLALALGTVAGLVALFAYPTSRNAPVDGTAQAPAAAQGSNAASGSTSGGSSSGASSSSGGSSSSSGDTGGSSSVSGTFTGAVAQTRWGPVQVQIVVQDGRITSADAIEYPDGNGRDVQINAYAIPQLNDEVVSAQSAQIDMVSGATVTSGGYQQSLQDAIDQAFA